MKVVWRAAGAAAVLATFFADVALASDYMKSFTPPVVLGGIDVVEYQFLNETDAGVFGSKEFQFQLLRTDISDAKLLMPDTNFTFYFKNQENLDLFASNPTQYAPQYGGY